jgi:hypothetical protein
VLATFIDTPPNSSIDSTTSPKVKTTKGIRSWGMLPNSYHFGGRKACWSFEMGIKTNDKWVNYSHGLAQTKQQVG